MQEIFSVLAGLFSIVGYVPYICAVLRKHNPTTPSKATWFVWMVVDFLTAAAMWSKGALNGQMTGVLVGVIVTTLLAFRYGKPGCSLTDIVCLIGAAFGIASWICLGNAFFGLVISLGTMVIGAVPTFAQLLDHPESEDAKAWLCWLISSEFAFAAISRWTVVDVLQPAAFVLVQTIIIFLIFRRSIVGPMRPIP